MTTYDAIVVGARCAGSPTAMLLARQGCRVLLLDRASFPSDTLSTHYIHQPGVARLQRWGLLDRVIASGCPPVEQQTFDVGPFALVGTPPPADGAVAGYAPRRTVLDKILVDAAGEAGVEIREQFGVDELLTDGERVTGILGRARDGAPFREHARLVIGADGLRSVVARQTNAPVYNELPSDSFAYYSYWSGVPTRGVELYPRPGRMIIAGPTNDGLTIVIVYWPDAEFHRVSGDVESAFTDAIDLVPNLAQRVRAGSRAERFRGTKMLHGYFRRPYGPGWALVGDAGYYKSPITAQGITDAFRDAELLAGAADDAFAGRAPFEEAFGSYERRRNEAVMPLYRMTGDLAKLSAPPPEMQALFGTLRSDAAEAGRFLGTIAGTVPIPEFFSPDRLRRLTARGEIPG